MYFLKSINFNAVLASRFKASLEEKRLELQRLTERKSQPGEDTYIQSIKRAVESALLFASECYKKKEIEPGWQYLHMAEEMMAELLHPEEMAAKASALREEAGTLDPRRKLTILELLDNNKPLSTTAYVEALRLRNDYYNCKYHKINLRRTVMMRLLAMMVVLVGVIVSMTYCNVFVEKPANWKAAWPATMLGMLGAALSMSYTLVNRPLDEKIPDQMIGSFVVWIRLAIGGAAAFVTILIGQSGLLEGIFNEKLLKAAYAYMIIAFVSGFSERLFIRVMQVVSNEQPSSAPATPPPPGSGRPDIGPNPQAGKIPEPGSGKKDAPAENPARISGKKPGDKKSGGAEIQKKVEPAGKKQ